MTNPFDDPDGIYHVVVNGEDQHALWPAFAAVPAGWTVRLAERSRAACLAYVSEQWTDMRPRSLIRDMEIAGGSAPPP